MIGSNTLKVRASIITARAAFLQQIEPLPDVFTATKPPPLHTYSGNYLRVNGKAVQRSMWRVWCSFGWIFQIEGDQWGKLPAYERFRWSER